MEFFQVLETRHSVRAYADTPVEDHRLKAVLSAAALAPSAGNLQAFRIYVVRDLAQRQALAAAAYGQGFVAIAPLVLVFCADLKRAASQGKVREQNYSTQDAIIAVAYAQLAAVDQGLASCWVGALDERQVSSALKLPEGMAPVALMTLGYGADTPVPVRRRLLSELVVDLGRGL